MINNIIIFSDLKHHLMPSLLIVAHNIMIHITYFVSVSCFKKQLSINFDTKILKRVIKNRNKAKNRINVVMKTGEVKSL